MAIKMTWGDFVGRLKRFRRTIKKGCKQIFAALSSSKRIVACVPSFADKAKPAADNLRPEPSLLWGHDGNLV